MLKLEEIKVNSLIRGILPSSAVTIKHVQMFGNEALEVTYVDGEGKASTQLLFRDQEPNLELVLQTRPLSFTADGHFFRLASEAQRLSLAFLFDPLIALNTSLLLFSSLTYGIAMLEVEKRRMGLTLFWLGVTGLFGLGFGAMRRRRR